ncbi:MAG: hypothetical protein IAG10_29435 [Planctomycetaceae bacterium]|nr:hypothetical protein [Planctomycetaceae bacterium]
MMRWVFACLTALGLLNAILKLFPYVQTHLALPSGTLGKILIANWRVHLATLIKATLELAAVAFFWQILPDRRTNAFYLRSFRNDRWSWPARKTIQATLGEEYRLSGIRNPRRRWPFIFGILALPFYVFRYLTPKFMNLEAGHDWKARLCRSLGDARCAFVDLSDRTPFVEDEVQLAYECLGLERVLFIGDTSQEKSLWKDSIARTLKLQRSDLEKINLSLWNPNNPRAFSASITAFAKALPAGNAGVKESTVSHVAKLTSEPDASRPQFYREFWIHLIAGASLAAVSIIASLIAFDATELIFTPPVLLMTVAQVYFFGLLFNFFIDCALSRQRACVLLVTAYYGCVMALMFAQALETLNAARNAQVVAEIRQMEQSLENFKQKYGVYPPSRITLYENGSEWDARSEGLLRRLWPRINLRRNRDFDGDGRSDKKLEFFGSQCLVFFLGGPATKGKLTGFAMNPDDPLSVEGKRDAPFFDFDPHRLDFSADAAFPSYRDSLPNQTQPYLYATSSWGGYNSDDLGGKMAKVYTASDGRPWMHRSFQIISPGLDSTYGTGGPYDSKTAADQLQGNRQVERDNVTNFSQGPLAP